MIIGITIKMIKMSFTRSTGMMNLFKSIRSFEVKVF